jgi:proteasome lid subunit RPN8/RPN11
MADSTPNEEVTMVEIPTTTLMKIVKHCREKGNDEGMGVLMGTVDYGTCFVGNSFPHHSKKSIVRHAPSAAKAKTTVIDKAVEYFENTNYDNTVVGVYINVPSGKFFSTDFIHEILSASNQDMLNDSKICIAYERTLAELGMNPFTAFKFTDSFVENIKNKKVDDLLKEKISIDELKIKIFRSSYDQAFLAEYVCPNLSEYSGKIYDDLSIADIC